MDERQARARPRECFFHSANDVPPREKNAKVTNGSRKQPRFQIRNSNMRSKLPFRNKLASRRKNSGHFPSRCPTLCMRTCARQSGRSRGRSPLTLRQSPEAEFSSGKPTLYGSSKPTRRRVKTADTHSEDLNLYGMRFLSSAGPGLRTRPSVPLVGGAM